MMHSMKQGAPTRTFYPFYGWCAYLMVSVLSFTFDRGESIVKMSTWTNGNEGMLRSGGFEFETSNGRHFFASAKSRGRKYTTEVGCGIVVGAHGR